MTSEILVVDDSAAERLWISHILRKGSDFSIRFASDGTEALRLVSDCRPAVIVSDLHMPGMSGLELVRQLKSAACDTPVLLMTSFGSEEIAVKALRAGAASYVPKRVMETDLLRTLQKVLALNMHKMNRRRHLENITLLESHSVLDNDDAALSNFVSYALEQTVQMKLLRGQELTQVGIALQEVLGEAIYQGNLGLDFGLRQLDEAAFLELAEQRRSQLPYASRRVFVEVRFDRSELRFVIRHEGEICELSEVGDTDSDPNMDRLHGRSLTLIRNFMDSVCFQPELRQTTLIKNVTVGRSDSRAMTETEVEFDLKTTQFWTSEKHLISARTQKAQQTDL